MKPVPLVQYLAQRLPTFCHSCFGAPLYCEKRERKSTELWKIEFGTPPACPSAADSVVTGSENASTTASTIQLHLVEMMHKSVTLARNDA